MIHFVEKTGYSLCQRWNWCLGARFDKKFIELGGTLECNAEVEKINVQPTGVFSKPKVTGLTLQDGRTFDFDIVCSNADYVIPI